MTAEQYAEAFIRANNPYYDSSDWAKQNYEQNGLNLTIRKKDLVEFIRQMNAIGYGGVQI